MAFIQKPTSDRSVTIGLFAPCDPRIDDAARERAMNICVMTGKILQAITLPGLFAGKREKPGIYVASKVIQNEADADSVAAEFKKNGVEVIAIVPDTWFYPGKTAIALTSHFPAAPICCIAGNNAPKPGVVGVDAVVGAYSQTSGSRASASSPATPIPCRWKRPSTTSTPPASSWVSSPCANR